MKAIKLNIRPYRNRRTGSTSWRVTGTLHGERIRKNFSDKLDAVAGKRTIELQAMQDTSGFRLAGTFLTDSQLREAEAAFLRLKDVPLPPSQSQPRPLAFYLDYTLTNYKETSNKTLAQAKEDYIKQREADEQNKLLSFVSLRTIKGSLKKLDEKYPGLLLSELDADKITAYCDEGEVSHKTHNHRRDMVSGLLTYAMKKEWITKNPIEKVIRYQTEHKRGSAAALTTEQAKKLMAHLETYEGGKYVPYYALALFAGIRPDVNKGELSKLPEEDIHLETGIIHIEPWVSKVGMKRNIAIQPNLAAWLKA